MSILQIVLIGIGLSMDAFAVSICKGLTLDKSDYKSPIIIASYFGFFQALMPYIGYILGSNFQKTFSSINHWIAFSLLIIIGLNMIKDSFNKKTIIKNNTNFKEMILLALATSIDALAVGFSFALLHNEIIFPITIIGTITFIISFVGVEIGKIFGYKFNNHAEILGGILLIIMGLSILLKHYYFISY